MTDIVLRIYSGSGAAWAETLDYEIHGVMDYKIVDDSGYAVDHAWFEVEDINHVLADGIDPDIDAAVQVWRAYSIDDGKLLGSGTVTKVEEFGSSIKIHGIGMNGLLKRRVVEDYSVTGNGTIEYTDILQSVTFGLIQGTLGLLPAAEYKAFDLTTHVVASDVAIPTGYELKYDNLTLYEVVVDICEKAVGAASRHYDCYLFEMDDADETVKPTLDTVDTAYKMCVYLKEKRSTASDKTIDAGDVDVGNLRWTNEKGGESYYNKVIIRGAFQEVNLCPITKDWWTEQSTDGAVTDFWSQVKGIETLTSDDVGEIVGSYMVSCDVGTVDSADSHGCVLNLTDADAFDSVYTADGMSSTNGFVIDRNKNQYLRFYIKCDASLVTEISGVELSAVTLYMTTDSGNFNELMIFQNSTPILTNASGPIHGLPVAESWYLVDVRVSDIVDADASYVEGVGFYLDYSGTDAAGDTFWIDGLYFYERDYQVQGSATKGGVTTNFKELIIELPELVNDDLCEKIAVEALKEQDVLQNGGLIPLIGPFKDVDLRAGNTVEVSIASMNLDVWAGAGGATSFEIERIVYSPNRQSLQVGQNVTAQQMAVRMKARALRAFNRLRR